MRIFGTSCMDYDEAVIARYDMGIELVHLASQAGLNHFEEIEEDFERYAKGSDYLSIHGAYYDMACTSVDELIVEVVKKRFLQSVETAQKYHVPTVVFHSTYAKHNGISAATKTRWLEKSVEFWRQFAPLIPAGVQVCIENVEDDKPSFFLELIQQVAPFGIACCFDVGHAFCNSSYPLEDWIAQLKPYIRHVHMHDNDGSHDQHLPIGKGSLPFQDILPLMIAALPAETPFVCECDMPDSLEWLSDHGFAAPFPG